MTNESNKSITKKMIQDVFSFGAIPGKELNPIQMFFRAILEVVLVLAIPSIIYAMISSFFVILKYWISKRFIAIVGYMVIKVVI